MRNSIGQRLVDLEIHNDNVAVQELCKARCATDILYFVNNWVWTYDPRQPVSYLPFVLFPRQEEFLEWMLKREETRTSGLADKSRDMGFTWLLAAYFVHRWLFRRGFAGGIGSRKEMLVDRLGDPDSIFEKMRIILRHLPKWMLPKGFDIDKHAGKLKISNPENGSVISGEAGDNIGRGGRKTVYAVDEAAFLMRQNVVDKALSNNSDVIIFVSTPQGPGNEFAKKRFSGAYPVFTMHWKQDPRKAYWIVVPKSWTASMNTEGQLHVTDADTLDFGIGNAPTVAENLKVIYPWYEEQLLKWDPITVAQEIDIDYNASIEGICCPGRWVRAAVEFHKRYNMPLGLVPVAGYDVAEEGRNRNVVIIRRGPVIGDTDVKDWSHTDTYQSAWIAADFIEKQGAKRVFFDADGVGASIAGNWKHAAKRLLFSFLGVRGGWHPTVTRWPNKKTSREMFINLRAEMWWNIRTRLEKTYQFIEHDVQYPMDEMISIPNIPILIAQLMSVLYDKNEAGKIRIESKKDMRERGVESPDFADALVYAFAPDIKPMENSKASSSLETM